MSYKIHIPTEQFGFLEAEVETVEEAKELSDSVIAVFRPNLTDIDSKEWNSTLDRYLSTNTMEADIYARMSDKQKNIIQEIKRSVKRLEYKNTK
jgi:polyhydroxyalkanoate synthesis regulator phasin